VEKPGLKKPRSLEDLAPQDREICKFFSNSGAVFNTVELINLEYNPKALKGYIGTFSVSASYLSLLAYCVGLASYALLFSCAGMVLNAEKRRQLAEIALKRKVAPDPSNADASTLVDAPPAATTAQALLL